MCPFRLRILDRHTRTHAYVPRGSSFPPSYSLTVSACFGPLVQAKTRPSRRYQRYARVTSGVRSHQVAHRDCSLDMQHLELERSARKLWPGFSSLM